MQLDKQSRANCALDLTDTPTVKAGLFTDSGGDDFNQSGFFDVSLAGFDEDGRNWIASQLDMRGRYHQLVSRHVLLERISNIADSFGLTANKAITAITEPQPEPQPAKGGVLAQYADCQRRRNSY